MRQIGAYEAKVHLGQILDDVLAGEPIEITRHGMPVARLMPIQTDKPVPIINAVERLLAFGKGKSNSAADFGDAIREGRR